MQTKKNEVKELILQAAKAEFLEKGFEKASLRSIAAAAGVTKGNIYTYFENKGELYTALVEPVMEQVKRSMQGSYDYDFIRTFLEDEKNHQNYLSGCSEAV